MQIDVMHENSVAFKITNTDDDAVMIFYSIIKKCRNEANKKGFRNMFSSIERDFLREFSDILLGNDTKD